MNNSNTRKPNARNADRNAPIFLSQHQEYGCLKKGSIGAAM